MIRRYFSGEGVLRCLVRVYEFLMRSLREARVVVFSLREGERKLQGGVRKKKCLCFKIHGHLILINELVNFFLF